MSAIGRKLRGISFGEAGSGIVFWCPGCDQAHAVRTSGTGGTGGRYTQARWEWNGDGDKPTISPSVLRRDWETDIKGQPSSVCHSFVRSGQIQFLDDCTHHLRGQTVPLPDWPEGV